MATLFYFHDPMCSWCWGYRPIAERLFSRLPAGVSRTNVLGGLAPDSDRPMPAAQREAIAGYWRRIEAQLGTKFNYDFWTRCEPRRSTYPACRAVIAASKQGREEEMIFAIQKAYYLEAQNPSDVTTLQRLAATLELDAERFRTDLLSRETETELQRQISFARDSNVAGFPSLAFEQSHRLTPLTLDYKSCARTLTEIQNLLDQRANT